MKVFRILILTWLIFISLLNAGEGGAFLKLGYGARALSLGKAFTSVVNDSYSSYWNPAGLGFSNKLSVTTTSFAWNESQAFYFGNITPLQQNYGALGLTYISFSSQPVDLYDTTGTYLGKSNTIGDQALILSYGKQIDNFSLGINLKSISSSLINLNATGRGLDLGLLYQLDFIDKKSGFSNVVLGFMMTDVGDTNIDFGNSNIDTITEQKKLGISTYLDDNKFLFSFDYWILKNRPNQKHYGMEYLLQENLSLCLGLQDEVTDTELLKQEQIFSIGSVLKYEGFEFSVATVFHPQENMNFFSLNYIFDSIFPRSASPQKTPEALTSLVKLYGPAYDEKTNGSIVAKVSIMNTKTNELVGEGISDATGQYLVNVSANAGDTLLLSAQAQDYLFYTLVFQVPSRNSPIWLKVPTPLQKISKNSKIVIKNISFSINSAELSADSKPVLDNVVDTLNSNPEIKLLITGYTDNMGDEIFNKQLSLDRANSVKAYIVSKGISGDRLNTAGLGSAKPVGDNNTYQGRFMNRRIELEID